MTNSLQIAIQDLHDLLLINQVGVELRLLVQDLMWLIGHIHPQQRNMKHRMHYWQTGWQGKLVGHLSYSLKNLKWTNIYRAQLASTPESHTSFRRGDFHANVISGSEAILMAPLIYIWALSVLCSPSHWWMFSITLWESSNNSRQTTNSCPPSSQHVRDLHSLSYNSLNGAIPMLSW